MMNNDDMSKRYMLLSKKTTGDVKRTDKCRYGGCHSTNYPETTSPQLLVLGGKIKSQPVSDMGFSQNGGSPSQNLGFKTKSWGNDWMICGYPMTSYGNLHMHGEDPSTNPRLFGSTQKKTMMFLNFYRIMFETSIRQQLLNLMCSHLSPHLSHIFSPCFFPTCSHVFPTFFPPFPMFLVTAPPGWHVRLGVGWWGGLITFPLHTYLTLRYWMFTCMGCLLACAHVPDATLLDVFLHVHTYVMLRA